MRNRAIFNVLLIPNNVDNTAAAEWYSNIDNVKLLNVFSIGELSELVKSRLKIDKDPDRLILIHTDLDNFENILKSKTKKLITDFWNDLKSLVREGHNVTLTLPSSISKRHLLVMLARKIKVLIKCESLDILKCDNSSKYLFRDLIKKQNDIGELVCYENEVSKGIALTMLTVRTKLYQSKIPIVPKIEVDDTYGTINMYNKLIYSIICDYCELM